MHQTTLRQRLLLVLGGLFLGIVLLEIGLRVGGFVFTSLQERANRLALKKDAYVILCLGESTTFNAYPKFLEEILNERVPGRTFKVIDKGKPGTNTGVIVSKLENDLTRYEPDIAITMMGINDNENTDFYGSQTPKRFYNSLRIYKLGKLVLENITSMIKATRGLKEGNKAEIEADRKVLEDINNKILEAEAGKNYKKAIEANRNDYEEYLALSQAYRKFGKYKEAVEICQKVLSAIPSCAIAYVELGHCYRDRDNQKAEEMYKKAIELQPENSAWHEAIGTFYKYRNKYTKAKEEFKKALELSPQNYEACIALGWCYEKEGEYKKAEDLFKRAIEVDPSNDLAYGAIAACYVDQKKYDSAQEAYSIAEKLRTGRYLPATVHNYKKLMEIILRRGIKLVVVQYPVRSIKPLKDILGEGKGITYVDNEKPFKNVLEHAQYKDYFKDNYGGDFGHCTPKGDRLLAENIAKTILREVFVGQNHPN